MAEHRDYYGHKDISAEDYENLKHFYYDKQNLFGRDRLYFAYKQQFPNSKISKRTLLEEFLKKQEIWQKITPPARKGAMRPILASSEGHYQIDCISMVSVSYNGFKYVVNAIDILTKRLFSKAIKQQNQQEIVQFLKDMKSINGIEIKSYMSDNGSEFLDFVQQWCRDNDIGWRFGRAGRPESQGQVERVNGTLKRMLYASMRLGNKNWVNTLPQIVENINNTISFATNMSPMQVQAQQSKDQVFNYIRTKKNKARRGFEPEFKVGDTVRILLPSESSDIRRKAKKGYFGDQVYKIHAKVPSKHEGYVASYKLFQESGEPVKGLFPATSLRLVPNDTVQTTISDEPAHAERLPEGEYEIEELIDKRVLRRRRGENETQYFVLWKNFPRSQATWEPAINLPRDSILQYEAINHQSQ